MQLAPAAILAARIAAGEIAAAEVVSAHLDRISAEVNAFVHVGASRALAEARSPRPGPLSGVPFTVKDTISVRGVPSIMGAPERRHAPAPAADATAVARLRSAGAILLGKTNCPPYGGGIETDNPVFGRTSNPYDLARSACGSSGGEAAAVASGCSAFGLGTDSGASVRLPAHFCGLAALKPTAGRVPVTGVLDDEGPLGPLRDPRTQIGILARAVADVALVLSVLDDPRGAAPSAAPSPPAAGVSSPPAPAGASPPAFGVPSPPAPAGASPPAFGVPSPPAPAVPSPLAPALPSVRGLRVSLLADDGISPPDADTARVLADAAAALAAAGAVITESLPPGGGHALTQEVWASYGAGVISYDLLGRWDAYRAELLAFADTCDLILSPVFPTAAPRHGEVANHTSYTTPQNMSGWPAATVRCGTSGDGLPIGVQIAAPPWRDELALGACLTLETALGGYVAP